MDEAATIDQIVLASDLPLSIIIVGVGDADFSAMENLDADKSPLMHSKLQTYQARDVVQFVRFNDFVNNPDDLVKEVLKEVPNQMAKYFKSKFMKPNAPRQSNVGA